MEQGWKAIPVVEGRTGSCEKTGLNPYRLLRDESVTLESARAYIQYGRMPRELQYDSWADYAIDMEIARLEQFDELFDE